MSTHAPSAFPLPVSIHFRTPGSRIRDTLHYATGNSPDGLVMVASTAHGLCAVFLGDDADLLAWRLAQAFPGNTLVHDPDGQQATLEQIIALSCHRPAQGTLALDIAGTAFQQDVWKALCEIPAGKTCSYTELAERVGRPAAVRAVASACGANHLAVVVPCHRAVRSDGSLSGYRWGKPRKQALLEREGSRPRS